MSFSVVLAAGYGLAVNLLAFALFGIDKRRAAAGAWRIRESTLLGAALAGGWIGAKAGQRRFRHKTRKQPFAGRLNAAGLLQLGVLVVLMSAAFLPPVENGAGTGRVAGLLERLMPVLTGESWPEEPAAPERSMPRRFGPGSGDGM